MSEAPTTTAASSEASPPTLELWIALGLAAIPQVAAFLFNGYGHLIVIVPVALMLTFASVAALVVAILQIRADRHASRPSHTAVWATVVLAAPWIAYAVYLGAIALMVRVFCVNQVCRGPLG